MNTHSLQAIILAAGRSSRFKTEKTKLAFTLCGQEMIMYPVTLIRDLHIPTLLVVGHQKEVVQTIVQRHGIQDIIFVEQVTQRGTGDAVASTHQHWNADNILVLNGDAPLLQKEMLLELITKHTASNAAVSFVVAHNSGQESLPYGRVVTENSITSVIEAKDFKGDPFAPCLINAGIYLFKRSFLENYYDKLQPNNNAKELYLTDLIGIASEQGLGTEIVHAPFDHIRGINTLKELWAAEHIKRSEIISNLMDHGVYFSGAQSSFIDLNVHIGAGTIIEGGVRISAGTTIGKNAHIGAFSTLHHCVIGDHVMIHPNTIIRDSQICEHASVGPFAHVRNHSIIGAQAIIGNFVEVSKSTIGLGTKIKHLSYIGNADIGAHVNIGAGTITCNYNGTTKHTTTIHDGAFIGSNASLIAPVSIGNNAVTAAGSVITHDVPSYALAIARSRQVNKEDYAQRMIIGEPFIAAVKTNDPLLHEES